MELVIFTFLPWLAPELVVALMLTLGTKLAVNRHTMSP